MSGQTAEKAGRARQARPAASKPAQTRRGLKASQSAAAVGPGLQGAADYVLERQVGFALRCAHQRATEVFNAVMGEFGVTPTQFAALAKLDDLKAVSQNQLGRLTAMDPATISGVISRLSSRGYVRAAPDPRDGRVLVLSLTEQGQAAAAAMKAAAAEVSRRTLASLSANETAALLRALAKIGQGSAR